MCSAGADTLTLISVKVGSAGFAALASCLWVLYLLHFARGQSSGLNNRFSVFLFLFLALTQLSVQDSTPCIHAMLPTTAGAHASLPISHLLDLKFNPAGESGKELSAISGKEYADGLSPFPSIKARNPSGRKWQRWRC